MKCKQRLLFPVFYSLSLFAVTLVAQDRASETRDSAKEVYNGLMTELGAADRITVRDIESAVAWSARIVVRKVTSQQDVLPERASRQWEAHLQRLNSLEKLIQAKLRKGQAKKYHVTAVRVLRDESRRIYDQARIRFEAMEVELPKAEAATPLVSKKATEVLVDQKNRYWIEGRYLSAVDVKSWMKKKSKAKELKSILIKAHEDSLHEHVIKLMDLAQQNGVADVRLSTIVQPSPLVIDVNKLGKVEVDGKRLSDRELETIVQARVKANPKATITIIADPAATLLDITRVQRLCNGSGIKAVRLVRRED